MEFKVKTIVPVSTDIWQAFSLSLILVSCWQFKGIACSNLPEEPCQLWRAHTGTLLWGRFAVFTLMLKNLHMPLRASSFSVSQLIAIETQIPRPEFQ